MPVLLMVVGFGWAALGVADLVVLFGKQPTDGVATFGLLFNMLLFILPGAVVGGIGYLMMNKRKAATQEKIDRDQGEQARINAAVKAALAAERASRE